MDKNADFLKELEVGLLSRSDKLKAVVILWHGMAEAFQALADRPVYLMGDRAKPGHDVTSRSIEHDEGYRLIAEMCRLMAVTVEVL